MEGNFVIRQVHLVVFLSMLGGGHTQTCTATQCSLDELNLPATISRTPQDNCFGVDGRVNFTCEEGHELGGPPYNECVDDQGVVKWKFGSSPFCEDVKACIPHEIQNGYSSPGPNADSTDGYTPFEFIEYSCDEGFIIQGPKSATCDLGGQWNPSSVPECLVTCGEAPPGTNGDYTSSSANFIVNAVVYFTCNDGFSTTDKVFLMCQADGTWSEDGPYCTDIDECDAGSDDCTLDNEICVNTVGAYQCECAPGFSRDTNGGCIDDVSLECSSNSFRVTINLARIGGVNASSIAFMGDQSCRAKAFNDTALVIESELNACGTSVSVTNDYVEYLNVVIDADDAYISAPDKILIPVTCSYLKSKMVNPRSFINDFKVVKALSRIRAARFDFLVYEDKQFLLPLLDDGLLLDFTSPIFLEVKAEYSGDIRAGVEQCWATDEDGDNRVQLITDGCPMDDSLVTYVETINPANFRFTISSGLTNVKGITEGRIHCDAVACDLNNDDSICSTSCGSSKRRKRSLNGFVHATRLSVG